MNVQDSDSAREACELANTVLGHYSEAHKQLRIARAKDPYNPDFCLDFISLYEGLNSYLISPYDEIRKKAWYLINSVDESLKKSIETILPKCKKSQEEIKRIHNNILAKPISEQLSDQELEAILCERSMDAIELFFHHSSNFSFNKNNISTKQVLQTISQTLGNLSTTCVWDGQVSTEP